MFGNNEKLLREEGDGGVTLRVVDGSPFYTIQGEGPFAGEPAVFIRLHGCHLSCHFCDTKFDDPNDPRILADTLAERARALAPNCKLAVITGGEPTRQPLGPLIRALHFHRFARVQIETAGNFWQDELADPGVYVVVSPKTGSVHPKIREHAAAWKYIVRAGETNPVDGLPVWSTQIKGQRLTLARPSGDAPVFLSPCDEYDEQSNTANRTLVAELAMRHGYYAGIQMHKYLSVP